MFQDKENLVVFTEAHKLVLTIYNLTKKFPKNEQFGLTSQMRRAAISVTSNIVEGKAKNSTKEFLRFMMISRGSFEEVKYQLYLAKDLGYIDNLEYNCVMEEFTTVGKLINGFIRALRAKE